MASTAVEWRHAHRVGFLCACLLACATATHTEDIDSGTSGSDASVDAVSSDSVAWLDGSDAGDVTCTPPLTACSGACVDLQSDDNHCGTCTTTCTADGGTTGTCINGACTVMADGGCNIALTATVTASPYGGAAPCCPPTRANDGVTQAADCGVSTWLEDTPSDPYEPPNWIAYEWPSAQTIKSMHVDTNNETVPNACGKEGRTLGTAEVQWWDGSWVTDGTVSNKSGSWDYTFTSPVTTTRVRLYATHCSGIDASPSTTVVCDPVIYEWEVYSCK
jgi:hypothetical protein